MFCLMRSFVPVWPYRATPVLGCAAGKSPGATLSALHPFLAYLKNVLQELVTNAFICRFVVWEGGVGRGGVVSSRGVWGSNMFLYAFKWS